MRAQTEEFGRDADPGPLADLLGELADLLGELADLLGELAELSRRGNGLYGWVCV